jgi:hypothetical protein
MGNAFFNLFLRKAYVAQPFYCPSHETLSLVMTILPPDPGPELMTKLTPTWLGGSNTHAKAYQNPDAALTVLVPPFANWSDMDPHCPKLFGL